jgi:hypothetical protein
MNDGKITLRHSQHFLQDALAFGIVCPKIVFLTPIFSKFISIIAWLGLYIIVASHECLRWQRSPCLSSVIVSALITAMPSHHNWDNELASHNDIKVDNIL